MLREMEKNRGGNPDQIAKSNLSIATTGSKSPTLPELGITRDNSSRWQKLAAIPEKLEFQHSRRGNETLPR
jgi:hypothetical protein